MNDRLTEKWTDTAEEAFGDTGKKGREGEVFMIDVFKSWGWDVEDHEGERRMQVMGIDLSFRNPKWHNLYTCDVKNNMDEYGCFYVYKEWLNKIQCDRVFHVNPNTGWVAWYGVDEMRAWYNFRVNRFNDDPDCIKLTPRKGPKFIKRSRIRG